MKRLVMLLSLPLGLVMSPAFAATYEFSGIATNMDGHPLYRERHTINGDCQGDRFRPLKHRVTYLPPDTKNNPSDKHFAWKKLDYTASPLRPSVDFSQPRFDEQMQIVNKGDTIANIHWQTPQGDDENAQVALNGDVVIDAGFVHFIQANWDTLNRGDSVNFSFLAPTRGEAYQFVAEPTANDAVDSHLVVALRPSSTLLNWLVDPVLLGFDQQGRITDYLGLGNIRKNADENYTIHLHYQPEEPPCPLIARPEVD